MESRNHNRQRWSENHELKEVKVMQPHSQMSTACVKGDVFMAVTLNCTSGGWFSNHINHIASHSGYIHCLKKLIMHNCSGLYLSVLTDLKTAIVYMCMFILYESKCISRYSKSICVHLCHPDLSV